MKPTYLRLIDNLKNERFLKITDKEVVLVSKSNDLLSLTYVSEAPAELKFSLLESVAQKEWEPVELKRIAEHYVYPYMTVEIWIPYR